MEPLKYVAIDGKELSKTKAISVGENIFCVTFSEIKAQNQHPDSDHEKTEKEKAEEK